MSEAAALNHCKGCGNPIIPGEPRYAGNERHDEYWHYDCWANTSSGKTCLDLYNNLPVAKNRKGKSHLDAKKGRDEHCPDGFLCSGWRLVRKDGIVRFGHGKHQHEVLLDYIGEYVYCQISDWTGCEITVYPQGLSFRDEINGKIFPEALPEIKKE